MKVAQGRHNLFFRYFYLFWIIIRLTHSFPMHPFYSPLKHQKTVRFSDEGVEKGCIENEWVKILRFPYDLKPTRVSDVVIDHLWNCQEKRNLTGKILADIYHTLQSFWENSVNTCLLASIGVYKHNGNFWQ